MARSAPLGPAVRTCAAPITVATANALTGCLRRNTTGTTIATLNGKVTQPPLDESTDPVPMRTSTNASTPSTRLGGRRSQAYREATGPEYGQGLRPVVILLAGLVSSCRVTIRWPDRPTRVPA